MSDNLRRYRAIHDALRRWYPGEPRGDRDRYLTTLAALIAGCGQPQRPIASDCHESPRR